MAFITTNIMLLRTTRRKNQRTLAREVGCSRPTLSAVERGASPRDPCLFNKIAVALGVHERLLREPIVILPDGQAVLASEVEVRAGV